MVLIHQARLFRESHKMAKEQGTPSYARQHKKGLTLAQQSAIDLLAAGKTDTEVAGLLSVSRPTVSKWRLYDPHFQAALHSRRAAIWGAAGDRLRSLVPKALDVLADILDVSKDESTRSKVAFQILHLSQLSPAAAQIGSTDADQIVAARVQAKAKAKAADRERYMTEADRYLAEILPPSKEQDDADAAAARADVWAEIEERLNGDEDEGQSPH
jgi:hypothetical protein